jgi:uncharacterized protein YbbC (DUF1343 family)
VLVAFRRHVVHGDARQHQLPDLLAQRQTRQRLLHPRRSHGRFNGGGINANHTGRTIAGESSIDVLHRRTDVELVALFAPEHGLRGTADAGERVVDGVDEKTGLTVYSLYGATRQPTREMLQGVDALVFDVQDIGTRYYTYVWTMALAMQSAAEHGVDIVVLDRPNPIGGTHVQGNVLRPGYATFVGLHPVPMRHGMTAGELARLVNTEFGVNARLHVVPVQGWRRALWYDHTQLPWVPPSPNMPDLESATHYPGTCLFEGTNLSVARGTPIAFQQLGAPWLNNEEIVRRLNARRLHGVRFEAVSFTPQNAADRKFNDQAVRGVRFITTDRATYDPTIAAIALLVEIQRLHADELTFHVAHFDRLAGTDRVRQQILAGADVQDITATWREQIERFDTLRRKYLLYE